VKIVLTREAGLRALVGNIYPSDATVSHVPLTTTDYRELDDVELDLRSLVDYGAFRALVVTSARTAECVPSARGALSSDGRVLSVGPATTQMLVDHGVVVSAQAQAVALDLVDQLPVGPVLILGARVMREELHDALEARGVTVAHVACYETLPVELSPDETALLRDADVVEIGAPSAWSVARDHVAPGAWVVVPGATTAEAVRVDHERVLERRGQSLRELLATLGPR
jgi:uroporphyrinogen-III synthase